MQRHLMEMAKSELERCYQYHFTAEKELGEKISCLIHERRGYRGRETDAEQCSKGCPLA